MNSVFYSALKVNVDHCHFFSSFRSEESVASGHWEAFQNDAVVANGALKNIFPYGLTCKPSVCTLKRNHNQHNSRWVVTGKVAVGYDGFTNQNLGATNLLSYEARIPLLEFWVFHKSTEARTKMNESDFEGTLVLEKLAAIGKVDDFFEAIDLDDFNRATSLMKLAHVDHDTIAIVLKKMHAADGEH